MQSQMHDHTRRRSPWNPSVQPARRTLMRRAGTVSYTACEYVHLARRSASGIALSLTMAGVGAQFRPEQGFSSSCAAPVQALIDRTR